MPERAQPDPVDVLVEIPRGSRQKYEFDKKSGRIRLDRVLYSSVHYPADYGFVLDTLALDGDALDALVLVEEPTFPGCVVPARPIATLKMRDRKGRDEKIIAVPIGDPRFEGVRALTDVAAHWRLEIETFFATYKQLEDDRTELYGWAGAREARRLIAEARARASAPSPRRRRAARSP